MCANFKHGGEILHTDKESRKICTDKNNARHRDIHTRAKCNNDLTSLEDLFKKENDNSKVLEDDENDIESNMLKYTQVDEGFDDGEASDNTPNDPDGSLDEA